MPDTFVAVVVVVLAILPGSVFTFAYESRVGHYGVTLPDRIYRFLAASAVLHALVSGLTYELYRRQLPGRLVQGEVNPLMVEAAAIAYVLVPYLGGRIAGAGVRKGWRVLRLLSADAPWPTAWERVFSQHPAGWVRLKLKSGSWIAGVVGGFAEQDMIGAYASGPEPQDIFLSASISVRPDNGEVVRDHQGRLVVQQGGILIRWGEIEYLQLFQQGRVAINVARRPSTGDHQPPPR